MYLNVPNLLTLLRILIIPFYIYELMLDNYIYALAFFLFGTLTDFFDGFLARRLKQITPLGKFLDPLADKLFFVLSLSIMSYKKLIPIWFFSIILIRDILVSIGSFIYIDKVGMKRISPHITGKLVNFFIFFITFFILIDHNIPTISFNPLYYPLYFITIGLSLFSLYKYWIRLKNI